MLELFAEVLSPNSPVHFPSQSCDAQSVVFRPQPSTPGDTLYTHMHGLSPGATRIGICVELNCTGPQAACLCLRATVLEGTTLTSWFL